MIYIDRYLKKITKMHVSYKKSCLISWSKLLLQSMKYDLQFKTFYLT